MMKLHSIILLALLASTSCVARNYEVDTKCENALKALGYAGVVDVTTKKQESNLSSETKQTLHQEMVNNARTCYQNCTDQKQVSFCNNMANILESEQ